MQPSATSIKDFYSGATVFVTGGTGYLGKPLIEKLLRSCEDIKCIYVLLRGKNGVSCEDRLEQLKLNQIFDRVRMENPEALNKLFYVNGDITVDNLGLNAGDEDLLNNTVNFVFHSAATVSFDNPIKVALNMNTLGTKRVLDLFRESKELKKLVYVSTAYANPGKDLVEEKVYKSLQKLDLDWYVKCADVLPPEMATKIMHQLQGFFPNTYTMTKFMAEQLIDDYRNRFGISAVIVRPSIIGPTYVEPVSGWVDSYCGANGIVAETVNGILPSLPFHPRAVMDVVPLDIVCNHLIVAAWFDTVNPSSDIRVVNCTSGDINGINYLDFFNLSVKHGRVFPTKYTNLYPNLRMPNNQIAHGALVAVHGYVPAYLQDVGLRLMGKRPIAVKMLQRITNIVHGTRFVTRKTFTFANKSVIHMQQAVQHCSDSAEFQFDCRSINWDDYLKMHVLGIQKYKLKINEGSLPAARRSLKGLYAAWCLYYGAVYILVGYVLYKLMCSIFVM